MNETDSHSWRNNPVLRGVVVALAALVAAILAYFLLIRDDSDSGAEASSADISAGAGAVEVKEGDLAALGEESKIPVYWAGEQGESALELTRTTDDRVFVRYLEDGAEIGSEQPDFLTVGTYPLKDAYGLLEEASQEDGAEVGEAPNDGLVVTNENARTSVYIAFPDEEFQIEVYDPDPDRAFELAESGQIEPVG